MSGLHYEPTSAPKASFSAIAGRLVVTLGPIGGYHGQDPGLAEDPHSCSQVTFGESHWHGCFIDQLIDPTDLHTVAVGFILSLWLSNRNNIFLASASICLVPLPTERECYDTPWNNLGEVIVGSSCQLRHALYSWQDKMKRNPWLPKTSGERSHSASICDWAKYYWGGAQDKH